MLEDTKRNKRSSLAEALARSPKPFESRSCYFRACKEPYREGRRASDNDIYLPDISWIPDWRNQDHYQSLMTKDKEVIAWEFLRRNRKYQMVIDDLLQYKHVNEICFKDFFSTDDKGRPQLRYLLRGGMRWFEGMFGTNSFADYREGATPNFLESRMIQSYCIDKNGEYYSYLSEDVRNGGLMADGEVIVCFDLYMGVEAQIKKFKQELKKLKEEEHIPKSNYTSKKSTQKLIQYLRILDIQATSGNQDHMNEVIKKNGYNGKYTAANKALETAEKIASVGYRSILISS